MNLNTKSLYRNKILDLNLDNPMLIDQMTKTT